MYRVLSQAALACSNVSVVTPDLPAPPFSICADPCPSHGNNISVTLNDHLMLPPSEVDSLKSTQLEILKDHLVLTGSTHCRGSMSSIKRDVKKKAPPRSEERDYFSRSSPLCFVISEDVRLFVHLVRFLCCWWQHRVCKTRQAGRVLTMVLSEARGLSLFLVIRGGIACNG